MIRFRCDGCGKEMKQGDLRYTVKIDVRAAYDQLEITLLDLVRPKNPRPLDVVIGPLAQPV